MEDIPSGIPSGTLADRIRCHRIRAGLTQQTLAERAGLALRTVSRIESGFDCTLGTLSDIARVLDVPVASLLPEPTEGAA